MDGLLNLLLYQLHPSDTQQISQKYILDKDIEFCSECVFVNFVMILVDDDEAAGDI